MTVELYNGLSKAKETFTPLDKGRVKMYCCGPTVYDYAHIGNLRSFIFYDVIKRTLEYEGLKVTQVINITDVDDKMIKNSAARGMRLGEYAAKYTDAFFADIDKVNIRRADLYPRATDNIEAMAEMVTALMHKGYAYQADDGIYYSISKFKGYGKLSGIDPTRIEARMKKDEYDKESVSDFALWKFWDADDGDVFWEGPLPKGRPGWHIECSAMGIKYLGETMDIHCGAVDLMFPHHENEIAQSEAYTGKKFVDYWLHPEHLLVGGQKMSKSLKNFYTLRDLEAMGFDPMSFRLMVLDAHYRSRLDFTPDSLEKYEKTLDDIDITLQRVQKLPLFHDTKTDTGVPRILESFEKAVKNDFDTHSALIAFFGLIDLANKRIREGKASDFEHKQMVEAFRKMDFVLGLFVELKVPDEVMKLVRERDELRDKKEWTAADAKRKVIKTMGYKIIDLEKHDHVIIKNREHGR